jgi:hypothetical protein
MLSKLVKYDFKWVNRTLVFYFLVTLILCVLTRITSYFDEVVVGKILFEILRGSSIAAFFSTMITAIIRCWIRFIETTYKDESYLVNTLPVNKNTLYNAKIVAGLLTILVSFIFVIIGFCIGILNQGIIDYLKNIWNDNNALILMIRVIVIVLLELVMAYFCGIVGILIGHKRNDKRQLWSVLCGIGLYFLVEILVLVLMAIYGIFSNDVGQLFTSGVTGGIENMNLVTGIITVLYVILIIVFYYIGKCIFKNGVNVD